MEKLFNVYNARYNWKPEEVQDLIHFSYYHCSYSYYRPSLIFLSGHNYSESPVKSQRTSMISKLYSPNIPCVHHSPPHFLQICERKWELNKVLTKMETRYSIRHYHFLDLYYKRGCTLDFHVIFKNSDFGVDRGAVIKFTHSCTF